MLNINEKTILELVIKDNALIVRPATKPHSKKEIKKIAQEIIDEYAEVFKKLAK